jgi:hypothetical protein
MLNRQLNININNWIWAGAYQDDARLEAVTWYLIGNGFIEIRTKIKKRMSK